MDRFSSKHFVFIILGVSIVSLKTYPTIFLIDGKRDSWIAIFIASAISFIFFMSMIRVCKKNSTYNLSKIYTTAFGTVLGKALLGLLILTLSITLVESAAVDANAMRSNMMPDTPVWYLILFFVIPSIYIVRQDLVAVVIVTLIGILLTFLSGINLSILTAQYKKFDLLFPLFENGLTYGFFICILKMVGLYGCVTIALPYLSRIKDTNKLMKHTAIGLFLLIQMQIVSVTGLIMTFTPERLVTLYYPKLLQTQLISYLRFLEFGELYVLLQTLGGWLLKYIITFYGLLILLRELNVKRTVMIYGVYGLSVFVILGAYFAANNTVLLFELLNYYSYICLVNFVFIPSLVFLRFSFVARGSKR